ncbi:hypothetical protein GCM10027565_27340 [Bordetella tumulicola]
MKGEALSFCGTSDFILALILNDANRSQNCANTSYRLYPRSPLFRVKADMDADRKESNGYDTKHGYRNGGSFFH